MVFNLQGKNTDLEVELLKSKEYYDWLNDGKPEELQTHISFGPSGIPVGTIEFVESQIGPQKPLIPPDHLRKWLKREHGEFISGCILEGEVYVKSTTRLKHPLNGFLSSGKLITSGPWFWTEKIPEILGEFRVFLGRRGEILDIRNYVGFEVWPNVLEVREMAKEIFEYYGRAVSFDVIVTPTCTRLLEIHDYFALGLYGFSDPAKLPFLINSWYQCLNL